MKKLLLLFLIAGSAAYAQSVSGNNNSGSLTTAAYSHSVGEIYVVPQNPDSASSGTIAAATQIVFNTLGGNDYAVSEGVKYYPNPVENYLTFELKQPVDLAKAVMTDTKGATVPFRLSGSNVIDMGALSPGIYFISFPNPNVKSIKIIKN